MSVPYTLFDPTGNLTVLAEAPRDAALAARLMAAEPSAEQAGFVSFPARGEAELQMAGGEFCGNATLCAGTLCCLRQGVETAAVRASGADRPLAVAAKRLPDGAFDTEGELPPPLSITEQRLDGYTLPVVRFSGIAHAIFAGELPRGTAERLVKRWCEALRADAMGIMFLDETARRMTPLVYVPAADTLFWESSCASGTAAVGAWTARRDGSAVTLALRQPGGTLRVTADRSRLLLRETVRVVKTAALDGGGKMG